MALVKTDSRHYADIAQAIRSRNGSEARYQPGQMMAAILALTAENMGSTIIVSAPAGSAVTCTCAETVKTAPEQDGLWQFDDCGLGIWVVSASRDGMTQEVSVEINEDDQRMRYEVQIEYVKFYGVQRDVTSTLPEWTRTDDGVGRTASASVGTVAGSSDFDACYPWSGMVRETLSTGDVMVKIPKFWYRRWREGNMEYLKIATANAAGFKLHPAFARGGRELEAIYIAAYKTAEDNRSRPNSVARSSVTRAQCRTASREKGAGWELMDIAALSALQMLFLVEFATFDSQTAVGRGYCDDSQFSGGKVKTGTTDSVPNFTGRPAGTDGLVDVVWRGMEGLWSSLLEYMDGINMDTTNAIYYVCRDSSVYADDITEGYTALSFPIPTPGTSFKYVSRLGLEEGENDYLMLPEVSGNASATTYICDTITTRADKWTVGKYGGRWYSKDRGGLFKTDGYSQSTEGNAHAGSRLIYIPQEVIA